MSNPSSYDSSVIMTISVDDSSWMHIKVFIFVPRDSAITSRNIYFGVDESLFCLGGFPFLCTNLHFVGFYPKYIFFIRQDEILTHGSLNSSGMGSYISVYSRI